MQLWKVELLKQRLASGAVSQRELFLYLLVWVALDAIIVAVDLGDPNKWDHISSALSVLTVVVGTTYVFVKNGGSAGLDFLPRYLALSWVLAVRFLVLVMVPAMVGYLIIHELISEVPEQATAGDVILVMVMEVAYYWRMGHHIGEIARPGRAA